MACIIETKYIGQAWMGCMEKVLKKGIPCKDNDVTIKEALDIFIKIKNPLIGDKILKKFANQDNITWMENNFFRKDISTQYGYNYQQRLFGYGKINQIKWVINRLRNNPQAKSATITLLKPGFDNKHVPCLVALDFKIRFNKLLLYSFFRSQDTYNKMYADALQLARLQQQVARALKQKAGFLCMHVISAHIYEKDFLKTKELLRDVNSSAYR
jgi:thymidylate synthase